MFIIAFICIIKLLEYTFAYWNYYIALNRPITTRHHFLKRSKIEFMVNFKEYIGLFCIRLKSNHLQCEVTNLF